MLLSKLDDVAIQTELEMERERLMWITNVFINFVVFLPLDDFISHLSLSLFFYRLTWELEDIKYNFLENYFETAANGRKLSYSTFIKWESVQAQLWYNTNGLSGDSSMIFIFLIAVITNIIDTVNVISKLYNYLQRESLLKYGSV